jgi:hypothetical protein
LSAEERGRGRRRFFWIDEIKFEKWVATIFARERKWVNFSIVGHHFRLAGTARVGRGERLWKSFADMPEEGEGAASLAFAGSEKTMRVSMAQTVDVRYRCTASAGSVRQS